MTNPFEAKYRGIKISNATIKSKVMTLQGIEQMLALLGFTKESEELYLLKD